MKHLFPIAYYVVFLISAFVTSGQSPVVPHKMTFAGISLTIHDDARAEIQKDVDALTKSPKYFDIKVERAKSYFPIIEKIFQEEGIPDEMKYLVLQESALIPDAVSTSNAVGFWQFKAATAGDFGLIINSEVDDRMNIVLATRGAARYFKKSNTFFNNWLLVIQSYQMGIGGTQRSLGGKFNGQRHMDINTSTYWYVKKFVAHLIAFRDLKIENPQIILSTVMLNKQTTIDEIAIRTGISAQLIREYNKWAKTGVVPADREYAVILPASAPALASLTGNPDSGAEQITRKPVIDIITVNGLRAVKAVSGDQLPALAIRGGVKFSKFLKWNEIDRGHKPADGQIYYIQAKSGSSGIRNFTSTGKESLWSISQQTGVRHSAIKKLNPDLGNGILKAGLVVRLSPENGIASKNKSVGVDSRKPFDWSSGQ
ncbi:MAG: transglycosylase SLT domain-containing protein [Cyclobacteriaceae bacterium]